MNELEVSDDLMPTDGNVFSFEPDEQEVKADNEERAMVSAAAPLLDEIVSWFDKEIADTNDIYKLNAESKVPLEAQVIARQEVKTFLEGSKSRLEVLRDAHIKR